MVVLFLHFLFNKHTILIFTLNNIWCIIITIEKQTVRKKVTQNMNKIYQIECLQDDGEWYPLKPIRFYTSYARAHSIIVKRFNNSLAINSGLRIVCYDLANKQVVSNND